MDHARVEHGFLIIRIKPIMKPGKDDRKASLVNDGDAVAHLIWTFYILKCYLMVSEPYIRGNFKSKRDIFQTVLQDKPTEYSIMDSVN